MPFSPSGTAGVRLPNRTYRLRPRRPRPQAAFTPPAPRTPATAALPQPGQRAPLPVDPQYDADVAGTTKQRDRILDALPGERSNALTEYGYTAGVGADGKPDYSKLTFDPSNPYSRAALLKRTYDQARAGSTNSMASRGQLYSGALQNQQNDLGFRQGRDENEMSKALAAFLNGSTARESQAQEDYELGIGQAGAGRVARAGDNPLYSPVPGSPQDPEAPDAPNTSTAGTAGGSADTTIIVRPSAAHGGRKWRYRRGASGRLIPIGPA